MRQCEPLPPKPTKDMEWAMEQMKDTEAEAILATPAAYPVDTVRVATLAFQGYQRQALLVKRIQRRNW